MSKKKPVGEQTDEPTFEESLQRLEEIVHLLEEGQIGLSEALERYEEGVKLLRRAYDLLQGAERKIELLSGVDADGNPITRPLDDTATFSQDEHGPGSGGPRARSPHPNPLPKGEGAKLGPLPKEEGLDDSHLREGNGGSDVDAPGGLF